MEPTELAEHYRSLISDMGNRTDPTKRTSRERLLYIEQLGYWRGWVRRQDLVDKFEISTPQASADLAAYNGLNPDALTYNSSEKRYESDASMRPVLSSARFEDALSILGHTKAAGFDAVVRIDLPLRAEPAAAVRQIVAASFSRQAIEVRYYSINAGAASWRWISPHAFAHDGYRWHVRAWCHTDSSYKDFVLGRVAGTRKSKESGKIPPDTDWTEYETVAFRASKDLTKGQREAVELDFAMKNGIGRVRVRRAMLFYTLTYLGLAERIHPYSRLLERAS